MWRTSTSWFGWLFNFTFSTPISVCFARGTVYVVAVRCLAVAIGKTQASITFGPILIQFIVRTVLGRRLHVGQDDLLGLVQLPGRDQRWRCVVFLRFVGGRLVQWLWLLLLWLRFRLWLGLGGRLCDRRAVVIVFLMRDFVLAGALLHPLVAGRFFGGHSFQRVPSVCWASQRQSQLIWNSSAHNFIELAAPETLTPDNGSRNRWSAGRWCAVCATMVLCRAFVCGSSSWWCSAGCRANRKTSDASTIGSAPLRAARWALPWCRLIARPHFRREKSDIRSTVRPICILLCACERKLKGN